MKRLACALALSGAVCAMVSSAPGALAAPARSSSGLQLSVITPDPDTIADRLSLDVSFRGGHVEAVELYLDNALVAKRQLGTAQSRGIITFSLDTVLLSEGSHDLLVKAVGPDGKSVTTSTRVRIPGVDLSAPVRIAYPRNGIEVSGTVPIRVDLTPNLQRQKPYVTFFVDRELKVLRNYPPYEYVWDTTRVTNGWHQIEAWTQAADAGSPFKARPVHVNVNNSGGQTRKQDAVPDLRAGGDPSKPVVLKPEPARTGAAPVDGAISTNARKASAASARPVRGRTVTAEPSSVGYAARTAPAGPRVVGDAGPTVGARLPRLMGGAVVQPPMRIASTTQPRGTLQDLLGNEALYAVVPPGRGASSTVTVQPGETLRSISRATGARPADIARLNNLPADSRIKAGASLVVPRSGAFDIAFNGVVLAFDVQPRIQAGVKLAPFRQIFEHTGGRLYWFGGDAQTVKAVNATRDIELRIGSDRAQVNNHALTMEHAPFLESGRTIVPLTFIRDALGVNIHFDRRTGRLLIESK